MRNLGKSYIHFEMQKACICLYALVGEIKNITNTAPRRSGKTTKILSLAEYCERLGVEYILVSLYEKPGFMSLEEAKMLLNRDGRFRVLSLPKRLVILCDECQLFDKRYLSIRYATMPIKH